MGDVNVLQGRGALTIIISLQQLAMFTLWFFTVFQVCYRKAVKLASIIMTGGEDHP
jgi:hypothetical protein